MIDVGVMSSVNKYTPVRVQSSQTMSFGAHRQSDRPASAVRAGATSMPAAWQTRDGPYHDTPSQYGIAVRSIGDIVLDPLRWAMSSKLHKAASAIVAITVIVTIIL